MFKIDFNFGIALYLGFVFFLVCILWILGERKTKAFSNFDREKKFVWQCDICTYTYVDSKNFSVSQCPRCGSYNERK
jgi:rRNA maturation endonuclease Nob1